MQKIETILKNNNYLGRGIIIGKSSNDICMAYFLTGRSENSRNRVLVEENNSLFTRAFDESKLEDPSLIIYSPMKSICNHTIITNGDHTDTIYYGIKNGITFEKSLETREFEPDEPNFTPRISGLISTFGYDFTYKLNILKKADDNASSCNRFTYSYSPINNVGHFIYTYMNNPEISFEGEPRKIEIPDDIDEFSKNIWDNLDENNKISLYVRYVNTHTGEVKKVLMNKNI